MIAVRVELPWILFDSSVVELTLFLSYTYSLMLIIEDFGGMQIFFGAINENVFILELYCFLYLSIIMYNY